MKASGSAVFFIGRGMMGVCFLALLFLGSGAAVRADRVVLVAGGGSSNPPAKAAETRLREPFGTAFDQSGNMWIIEMVSGNRLLRIDQQGDLVHVAGRLQAGSSGDGGPALEAQFNGPHNLAVLNGGRVLVGDTWNGRVREVTVTNVENSLVRSLPGFEVPESKAKAAGPYCITLDDSGKLLYIADLTQVWALNLDSGQIRRAAGNGKKGRPEDGSLAVDAPLSDPRAVAPDHLGNLYILERGGNALRMVDREGRIKTVVNRSGKVGNSGDGGPAVDALMNGPKHLCVDRDNSVLIADAENNVVRRYLPSEGTIVRVAGTGKQGSAGVGGAPEQCQLARPHGVTIHPVSGDLYITDSYNDRILRIERQ